MSQMWFTSIPYPPGGVSIHNPGRSQLDTTKVAMAAYVSVTQEPCLMDMCISGLDGEPLALRAPDDWYGAFGGSCLLGTQVCFKTGKTSSTWMPVACF